MVISLLKHLSHCNLLLHSYLSCLYANSLRTEAMPDFCARNLVFLDSHSSPFCCELQESDSYQLHEVQPMEKRERGQGFHQLDESLNQRSHTAPARWPSPQGSGLDSVNFLSSLQPRINNLPDVTSSRLLHYPLFSYILPSPLKAVSLLNPPRITNYQSLVGPD